MGLMASWRGLKQEVDILHQRIRQLEAENESLKDGSCRFNCRTMREAFIAGFDAGVDDTIDGGKIICDDLYREVTQKAYKQWRKEGA